MELRVLPWDATGAGRAIIPVWRRDGSTIAAYLLRWDGKKLHPPSGPATVLEKCGGAAWDLEVRPRAKGQPPAARRVPLPPPAKRRSRRP